MRQPMITRTIQTTYASILCLDIESGEPCNKDITLPRTYKDDKAIMKAAAPLLETDTIKPVHVVYSCVKETLYGMTEIDFINHATVLPPRANGKAE